MHKIKRDPLLWQNHTKAIPASSGKSIKETQIIHFSWKWPQNVSDRLLLLFFFFFYMSMRGEMTMKFTKKGKTEKYFFQIRQAGLWFNHPVIHNAKLNRTSEKSVVLVACARSSLQPVFKSVVKQWPLAAVVFMTRACWRHVGRRSSGSDKKRKRKNKKTTRHLQILWTCWEAWTGWDARQVRLLPHNNH